MYINILKIIFSRVFVFMWDGILYFVIVLFVLFVRLEKRGFVVCLLVVEVVVFICDFRDF